MIYAIQNVNGQWWTGECWGVEQAREEYECTTFEDLPTFVGEEGTRNYLCFDSCGTGPMDVSYFRMDEAMGFPYGDAIATVRRVKGGPR